jgi:hypothetical protein
MAGMNREPVQIQLSNLLTEIREPGLEVLYSLFIEANRDNGAGGI